MNILYVYAHPGTASLNAQMKASALQYLQSKKINYELADLYAEKFQAVATYQDFGLENSVSNTTFFAAQKNAYADNLLAADIKNALAKIERADHLIFQFPLWWFNVPAILKGWFDRVLVKGFAYDTGKILKHGLLSGKTASLVVTTQSAETAYQTNGVQGATLDAFLLPIQHTLNFVGIATRAPFVCYAAFELNATQVNATLANYQEYLDQLIKSN